MIRRQRAGLLTALMVICVFFSGCAQKSAPVIWQESTLEQTEMETETAVTDAAMPETPREIVVDISGAVAHPGVYRLREGDRVGDAVQLAGGLLADADADSLNQAAYVKDADKIRVYTKEETQEGVRAEEQTEDGRVNLNTADVSQLCTLSGIGEARAGDIIAYREAHGGFGSIEEIMEVSGIKQAVFDKIKGEITVG